MALIATKIQFTRNQWRYDKTTLLPRPLQVYKRLLTIPRMSRVVTVTSFSEMSITLRLIIRPSKPFRACKQLISN